MRVSDNHYRDEVRARRRLHPRLAAVLTVTAAFGAVQAATIVKPPATADAIICVGVGRVIGISDCFGGRREFAPLPANYPPPASPPPPPTTSTPPPPPAPSP